MKPEGASFDDIGLGVVEEGISNVAELSDNAATASLEVLRQISSSGYLRKRLPQELVVLQGGATATGFAESRAVFAGSAAAVVETLKSDAAPKNRVRRDRCGSQGEDAGLRRRGLWRVRQLHARAQRHLHEMQHLRRHVGV